MDRYECKVCNYIYVPEDGDPKSGIPADTSFKDLPKMWICPVCGSDKSDFEKER